MSVTDDRLQRMRPFSDGTAPKIPAGELPPGPRWPALVQSIALVRFRHWFVPRMHAKYGDVFTVRIMPQGSALVLFTRPEQAKEIFAGDPEVFHAGKGNAILGPIMGEHSLLLQDSTEHKRARKLLMPAFNGAALRGYQELVTRIAQGRGRRLDARQQLPLARPDERPHPRGDPPRRLRRHRREAARRAPAAGEQDRRRQPRHPARLGLPVAAEVRAVEAHRREPARARPGDVRRDRRAPHGPRPRRAHRRPLPAAAGRRRHRRGAAHRHRAARPARHAAARRPRDDGDRTVLGALRARPRRGPAGQGARRRRRR